MESLGGVVLGDGVVLKTLRLVSCERWERRGVRMLGRPDERSRQGLYRWDCDGKNCWDMRRGTSVHGGNEAAEEQ